MAEPDVTRWFGYSYSEIKELERECSRYRFALHEIIHGAFNRQPPRDLRTAKRIAVRALVKKGDR